MKKALTILLVTFSIGMTDLIGQVSPIKYITSQDDIYFLTKTDYLIDPIPQSMSGIIKIGKGVKLGNPNDPSLKLNELVYVSKIPDDTLITAFDNFDTLKGFSKKMNVSKKVPADAYKQSTTQYIESVSEDELAQAIYFNFGAKFGFGNFSAALSHVQSQINKSHTIIFTRKVEVGTQQNYNDIRINKKSRSKLNTIEKLDSTSVRLDVFAGTFGSHYIESITYGYRIAIYANLESTDQSKITEFSASFNNLTYDASLNASQKAFFSSNKIKIFCNIFSGTATSDAKLTLTNFDDIAKFLSGLKDGSLELEYAPVACKIASFRPLIIPTDFPNIYSMLKPVTGEQVTAPYGVPAGTVIAWYPNVFVGLSDEKITELLPTGWKICDGAVYGNFTTPNLTSRFIMGTNTISELNNTGGSAEHEHNGSIGASTSKDRKDNSRDDSYSASSSHSHSLTIDKSNNLPPFWKLIYIIKLPVN